MLEDAMTSRCFVIGPIGSKFAPIGDPARDAYEDALEVFEKVVQPACRSVGLDPVRADQIAATGEITEQVFRRLRDDEVVIADVSGGNPNVMYELGLRHTRKHLTIQIGEYGQLPFDVSAIRTIQFSRSERGLIDARKELERALSTGLVDAGNPVSASRIWNEPGRAEVEGDGVDSTETAHLSTEEAIEPEGLIDQMAAFEAALPELTSTTEKIGSVVEEMGAITVDSTATIQAASATNPSAQQRLTLITRFSQKLQPKAGELENLTRNYEEKMNEVDRQLTGILDYLEGTSDELGPEVNSFLEAIPEMARSSREAMENFGQFKVAMDSLSSMSKVLRRPARDITNSVGRMMTVTLKADNWETQVLRIRKRRAQAQQPDITV